MKKLNVKQVVGAYLISGGPFPHPPPPPRGYGPDVY